MPASHRPISHLKGEPMTMTFEAAIAARTQAMLDACTRCGKCVEVCPMTGRRASMPHPKDVICGVLDIVRFGDGPQASQSGPGLHAQRRLHQGLRLRGQPALPARHGARGDAQRHRNDCETCAARRGIDQFRAVADARPCSRGCNSTKTSSRGSARRSRIGSTAARLPSRASDPDFVFYTGCNVLKTPHIALLASTSWTRSASTIR